MFYNWLFLMPLSSGYEYFGDRTSYFTNGNEDTGLGDLESCEIKMFWNFARHGARVPNLGTVTDWKENLPGIRDQVVTAYDEGNSGLSEATIGALKLWYLGVTEEDAEQLTQSGWEEHQNMGERWAKRLSSFSFTPMSMKTSASTYQRTIDSAKAFMTGMFLEEKTEDGEIRERTLSERKRLAEIPPVMQDNHLVRFYDFCDRFQEEVDNNPETYAEEALLEETEYWLEMKEDVEATTGVELEFDDVILIWNMCRYERAWTPIVQPGSPWCALFSDDDLKIINYRNCLWRWWSNSYAFNITAQQTQPLVFNLVDSLLNSETRNENVILNFGHSDGVQPFMTALGLYRDANPLLASSWPDNVADLQWDVSKMASFAANVGVVLASCPGDAEASVTMFHNERVVSQPKCGDKTSCPLSEFVQGLADIAYVDFDDLCAVEAKDLRELLQTEFNPHRSHH